MIRKPRPQIYFLRPVGQEGPIKVGFSHDIGERLRQCGKWSPLALEIVATVNVPVRDDDVNTGECSRFERRFHLRYAEHRMHHEWFAAHPLILLDIGSINAGTFDTSVLPEWRKVTNEFCRREYA